MKILRVTSDIYPFVIGGLGVHAHELSKQQTKLGHDVTVYAINRDTNTNQKLETNYKIYTFKNALKIFGNSLSITLFEELFKNRNNFDIVHAHSHLFFSTNMCAFIKKLGSPPLVITNHGLISQTAPLWLNKIYLRTIAKSTFKSADKIICYTEEEKLALEYLNINPDKIVVIHNGIDPSLFLPEMRKEKSNQLLWIGRFIPGKGVEYLIDAFYILLKTNSHLKLLMIGEGILKNKIYEHIRALNLQDNIIIRDFIQNPDLPELYRQSDVFILPSINEGVPRTILEAMSCGTPVVCTDLPQLRDIVNGCGILVPLRDPKAIACAVSKISSDEELAKRLGKNGIKMVSNKFNWNDTVKRTIELYEEVLCQK